MSSHAVELRALRIIASLPPNARRAAINWLSALDEAEARDQTKRDLRNARRRARRRIARAAVVEE